MQADQGPDGRAGAGAEGLQGGRGPRRDSAARVRTARGELKPRLVDQGADQQVRAVEVSGAGIEPVTLYIDAASGLVLRELYRLPDRSGSAEELFADYRDVEEVEDRVSGDGAPQWSPGARAVGHRVQGEPSAEARVVRKTFGAVQGSRLPWARLAR